MPKSMDDILVAAGQGNGKFDARPPVSSRGPWTEFFSRLKEEARPIWALYAACILALLTVCSMLGTPILNPLVPLKLSNTSLVAGNGHATLVVDRMRTRLLFVDDAPSIVRVIETGDGVVPIDEVTDVAFGDDTVYVAGLTRMKDEKSIASEAVLAFGLDGTFLETVWQETYDEGSYRPSSSVVDLEADESGVVILRRVILGEKSRSVGLFHVGAGDSQRLMRTAILSMQFHDASYDCSSNQLFVISTTGEVFAVDERGTSRPFADNSVRCKELDASGGRLALHDASSGEMLILGGLEKGTSVERLESVPSARSARLYDDSLYLVLDDGSFLLENLDSGDSLRVSELSLRPRLALSFGTYCASLLLLIVVIIIWALLTLDSMRKQNELDKIRRIAISIAVGLICALATGLLSHSSYTKEWETRENQLHQMGSYLSYISTEALGESITQEVQRIDGALPSDEEVGDEALLQAVNGLSLSAHESGIGVSCKLYVVSEDGSQVFAVISSDSDVVVGERILDKELSETVLQVASKTSAASMSAMSRAERAARSSTSLDYESGDVALGMVLSPLISPDGTCRMVAQVSCHKLTFVRGFLKNVLSEALTFALFAIGFYLVSDEVLKFADTLMDFRRSEEQDVESFRTRSTRPLAFLHSVTLFMDAALVAVLTRSLLLATGARPSAALLAVPVFAASFGMTVSNWIGNPLAKRHSPRIIALAYITIGLLAQLICLYAIQKNRFEWYVIGKFFTSFGYGYLYDVFYKLAECSPEDTFAAYAGIEQGGRSGGIVAGIVGGLFASLGSTWIYAFSAFLGAALLWALWTTLPDDRAQTEGKGSKVDAMEQANEAQSMVKSTNKFLVSPQMILTTLFGLIPIAIAGGYKSYVLPLFLNASSYTNRQVSNFSVICNLAFYLASKYLRSFRLNADGWLSTWVSLAGIAVLFGMFARNQSTTWAILAAILISILCWFANKCRSCAREFARVEYGLDYDQAYESVALVESIAKDIRPVAMGAFLSLGTTNGCLALAALMIVCSILYAITIRPYYQRVREMDEASATAA